MTTQRTRGTLSSFKANVGDSTCEGIGVFREAQYVDEEYVPYKRIAHFELCGDTSLDEAWANALLFLAAPEMLAALETCAEALERIPYQGADEMRLGTGALKVARAAIAKAKGGQS